MNVREELYVSGAGLTVAYVYQAKTRRRVAVMDTARRSRAAVMAMLVKGVPPIEVARALDMPLRAVCLFGIAGYRARGKIGGAKGNPTFILAKGHNPT
jgi:hypothetical protein